MSSERRGQPRDAVGRCVAVIRLATLITIALTTELVPLAFKVHLQHPFLELTLGAAGVYTLVVLWLTFTDTHEPSLFLCGLIDVALICAFTYESGGAISQARKAFFLLPVIAAMLRRPRLTAVWTCAAMSAFILITLPHPNADGPGGDAAVYSHAAYIGLVGVAATMVSLILAQERDHILDLATARRQLLAWTLTAEDRARQDLAYALHDGPVQNLLAVLRLQDHVHNGCDGSREDSKRVLRETIQELRAAIFDLHPHTLAHAGLSGALRAIAADAATKNDLHVTVELDDSAAGIHDELLFACARELVTNVVKHARATHLELILDRTGEDLVLVVVDDGVGLPSLPSSRPGHLGLSAMNERISAVNGRLRIVPVAGPGTRIELRLPYAADADAAPERAAAPAPEIQASRQSELVGASRSATQS